MLASVYPVKRTRRDLAVVIARNYKRIVPMYGWMRSHKQVGEVDLVPDTKYIYICTRYPSSYNQLYIHAYQYGAVGMYLVQQRYRVHIPGYK